MDHVHYISSVSGGTWASAAYAFLPSEFDEGDFLGPATLNPADLTVFEFDAKQKYNALDYLAPNNLGHVPPRLNFLDDIQVIVDLKEKYGYPNDVLWQGLIGERIFNLWNLWTVGSDGLPTQYYSRNQRYVEKAVLDNNPSLRVSDFVLNQRTRPHLIMNSSIVSNPLQEGAQLLPFESSEVGIGVRATFNDGVNGQTIGGGLIQPFAMGSTWISDIANTDLANVTMPSRPFSLVDMAGISSAAFAQDVQAKFPVFDGIVPKYDYWPVANRQNTPVYNYDFADGGSLENTGLLSLLARNVRRVIVFANAATPLANDGGQITVSTEIAMLFGVPPTELAMATKEPHQQVPPNDDWTFNKVFLEGEYQELLNALWQKNGVEGKPAIVKQTLAVQPNANWGIAGFTIAFLPVIIVAYAMRNESEAAQQNVELVRRNRELAILTESSTQILSAETDHETLRRLMSLLSKLAKMKACAVVTWEPNPDIPPTVHRFGECLPTDQDILRWVEAAGFAQSAPSRAFIFQSDMRKFPLSSGQAIQVLIGIQTPEVIYGILLFETEDLSILKAGSLNLLTLLVNQTALSVQDQLLRREMRETTAQLESNAATMATILDVSNSLIGQFEVDAVLTRVAQAIRRALGFENVVFAVRDPRTNEYVRRAHAGLDDVWEEVRKKHVTPAEIEAFFNPEFKASSSYFVSHTALHKSEHDFFVRPEDADDGFLKPDEWHENDLLLVPLMSPGQSMDQMIGFLSVREPHDRRIPTIEKVRTLEIFATQAVTALQSARQYEEIRRLTFIDALTPAYNHRFFQDALAKEIHRHARTGRELALAMLDIDNFKKINDTCGHPIGDEILKGLVEELMAKARDSDVVARYGGEEFAIIFPDTAAQSARDAANRLRELIERRVFTLPQLSRTLHITVSIGLAVYPRDGATPADLISRADAALYFAKKNGKNQVAVAGEVVGAEAM